MMKNLFITIAFLVFSLVCFIPDSIYAQDQVFDEVTLLNGEESIGKVTEIGDTYIKFIHKGETLVYTFKRENINKIQFASGRVEFITEATVASNDNEKESNSSIQSHHNIIAVLPFSFIGLGGSRDEKMGIKAQSDCYNLFKKYSDQFSLQDPVTTNALLIKHNINETNIAGFLPAEIANLLGVEYIVMGIITINHTGASTGGGSYYSGKNKGKNNVGYILGASTTTNKFATSVDMKIYTDQGNNIFAQSHNSFWPTENAYEITLQYLIKKTPLYRK